jgi:hypothetical protein
MKTKRNLKQYQSVMKENISLNFYFMSLELSNSLDLEYWIENSY